MTRARILIVAKDGAAAEALGDRLHTLGHTVTEPAPGLEAVVAAVDTQAPDLVLLDVECLEGPSDAEALSRLRDRLPVPVVFLAPAAGDPRLSGLRPLGPLDCLIQPVADPLLTAAVETARCRQDAENAVSAARRHEAVAILAGGLAHDFNNLLSGMLGYVELAQMGMDPQDRGFQHLTKAKDTCQRAVSLMQQFMNIARRPFHPVREGDILELVREVAGKVLAGRGVSVVWFVADDLRPAVYDEPLMRRAFIEVFTNAVDAMPEGGRIAVAVENFTVESPGGGNGVPTRAGDYVRIAIRDTGKGIPVVDPERLFTPRVETIGPDVHTRVGLGLTVVQSILKKHKGVISVMSAPDEGTTVVLYVPARK